MSDNNNGSNSSNGNNSGNNTNNNSNNGSNQNVYMAPLNDYEALFKIDLNFDANILKWMKQYYQIILHALFKVILIM